MDKNTFAKGDLLLVSEGEYSDYGAVGLLRVTKGFHLPTLWDKWLETVPEPDSYGGPGIENFVHFLLHVEKVAEDVTYREVNMNYSFNAAPWKERTNISHSGVLLTECGPFVKSDREFE